MATILLIEDDATFSMILENFLQKKGYSVQCRANVKTGLQELNRKAYDILLLDYRLPDGTGIDILNEARLLYPNIPAIIMTSVNDVRIAVKAIRSGALDYITKPVNPDELELLLKEAVAPQDLPAVLTQSAGPTYIQGQSERSAKLHEFIALVAPTDMTVIIQGESGTGKEYVASAIHRASKRQKEAFVAIDCGSLSKELAASELFGHMKGAFTGALSDKKGQMEAANGGTLFLDEVGNLSYEVQVQLLRAIQERVIQPVGSNKQIKVDVRILTATNDDLLDSVAKGDFREDLYHRLNEFKIQVPPLRNREEDLFVFVEHFMKQANHDLNRKVKFLSKEVRELFRQYEWPGNLRELKNTVRRMVLLSAGDTAQLSSLPEEMSLQTQKPASTPASDLRSVTEMHEKELIVETLKKVKYNKSKAAKLLNIDRTTLYNKIEKYQIE